MDRKKIIAITMGDPAGVGPEITAKLFAEGGIFDYCRPVVIGDSSVMEKAALITGASLRINSISRVEDAAFEQGSVDVLELAAVDPEKHAFGELSEMCGNAAFLYVKRAIELALAGKVDATVTNPLNKEALNLAGHHFSGHTEIYAEFTGTEKYTMLLAHENLRVVHVSTHVSLREACDRVKRARVLDVIRIANDACLRLGISRPRIAVAGLNPHCGEGGLFGREEIDEIIPAINDAKLMGLDVYGPIPPDTIFAKVRGGMYDIAVAMYHDQGHIPLKMAGFIYDETRGEWQSVSGVNITLGLPIIRTSVDHGTAFDLAGTGKANPDSLKSAVEYAVKLAENK